MAVPYDTAAQRHGDDAFKGRAEACIAEQAAIFTNDGRPDIAALAGGVLAGNDIDVASIFRQVTVTDTGGDPGTDDQAMLSAVQTVWPTVAAARYPQPEPEEPS